MANEITGFRDTPPTEYLALALDLFRGKPVSARQAGLAITNIASYVEGMLLPGIDDDTRQIARNAMLAEAPDDPQTVEAAFALAMPDSTGTMRAGRLPAGTWLTILKALLKFLPLILV